MGKIHQLSSQVIAKIAAGEVIERPAYGVKELVENAIDAHATHIAIHIERAGLQKITVIDNGEGMGREDLILAVKSHTTSKLSPKDDVFAVQTLGFRGEALASLGAVSRLTIKSKLASKQIGTQLVVTNGHIGKPTDIGMAAGTMVTVEQLFHTTPARKKFLKSPQTEFRHIVDIVTHLALSHPQIQFLLTHNNRTVLNLPREKERRNRISHILQKDMDMEYIPVTFEDSYIQIQGYLAKPQFSTTSKQYIFVNSRNVGDTTIVQAVKEGYGTLLPSSVSPSFIFFISIPKEMLDVNIHPRKEEVRFVDSKRLVAGITQAVTSTLQQHNISFHNTSWWGSQQQTTKTVAAHLLRDSLVHTLPTTSNNTQLIQIDKTYILQYTSDGIFLYDQHAVHERILFEELMTSFTNKRKQSKLYQFPHPITLSLSIHEKLVWKDYKKEIESLGFIVKEKQGTLTMTHLPELLRDRNPKQLMQELLSSLTKDTGNKTIDTITHAMIAYLACRTAVKAGDTLTEKQMKQLLTDLIKTPNNTTCPHGRPTHIIVSMQQLHRMFKRI